MSGQPDGIFLSDEVIRQLTPRDQAAIEHAMKLEVERQRAINEAVSRSRGPDITEVVRVERGSDRRRQELEKFRGGRVVSPMDRRFDPE